jgi:hypothetical protein
MSRFKKYYVLILYFDTCLFESSAIGGSRMAGVLTILVAIHPLRFLWERFRVEGGNPASNS